MDSTPRKIQFDDELAQEYSDCIKSSYLYRIRETDELLEVEMAFGEMLERQSTGGFIKIEENCEAARALPDEFERDEIIPRQHQELRARAKWPMTSVRGGVNPDQVGELRQLWIKNGITGCEALENGDVRWHTERAKTADCHLRNMYDRDAGYSGAAPKNL